MKRIEYSKEKSQRLKRTRGVSFEDIKDTIDSGRLIAIIDNPNQKRYPKQKLMIVNLHHYVHVVPFVENEEKIFLKTIFPSRKYTKKYISKKEEKV